MVVGHRELWGRKSTALLSTEGEAYRLWSEFGKTAAAALFAEMQKHEIEFRTLRLALCAGVSDRVEGSAFSQGDSASQQRLREGKARKVKSYTEKEKQHVKKARAAALAKGCPPQGCPPS